MADQADEKKVCGAKLRGKDATCQITTLMANGRCRIHGGKTPSGIASLNYKHGRHARLTKVLPARMRRRFEQAALDPHLLELVPDIGLIDARLEELIEKVDKGESGHLWDSLKAAHDEYRKALAQENLKLAGFHLQKVFNIIEAGHHDVQAWREIQSVINQRKQLVESERKRLIESEQVIFLHEATEHYRRMGDVVRQVITDETIKTLTATQLLARIQQGFEASILGGGVQFGAVGERSAGH
jgi:hypothetical protein